MFIALQLALPSPLDVKQPFNPLCWSPHSSEQLANQTSSSHSWLLVLYRNWSEAWGGQHKSTGFSEPLNTFQNQMESCFWSHLGDVLMHGEAFVVTGICGFPRLHVPSTHYKYNEGRFSIWLNVKNKLFCSEKRASSFRSLLLFANLTSLKEISFYSL